MNGGGLRKQAAAELFRCYAERLIALARSRLPVQLNRRVDPEDVMQSVYRCFFAGAREGQYRIQEEDDLWHLLTCITLRKVRDQIRNNQCEKRNVK